MWKKINQIKYIYIYTHTEIHTQIDYGQGGELYSWRSSMVERIFIVLSCTFKILNIRIGYLFQSKIQTTEETNKDGELLFGIVI